MAENGRKCSHPASSMDLYGHPAADRFIAGTQNSIWQKWWRRHNNCRHIVHMKIRAIMLSLFLLLPLYSWSSTTRQVRDTLIMGNVKYAINQAPLGHLDSLHYFSLREQVGFNEFFSWNFRGYVATWRVG